MSMNQDLISGDSNFKAGTSTSFATGSVCPKTGLYKTDDGKIVVIEYYSLNDIFRSSPSGNNKKCLWTRVTKTTDGSRTSFQAVKVEAGTV